MFDDFEVPLRYQFSGTTSPAPKCQTTHECFDILEGNVNETLIFFEWIESRLLPAGGRGGATSDPWVFALWVRKIAILAERCAIFRCLPGLPWRRLPIYIAIYSYIYSAKLALMLLQKCFAEALF